MKIAAKLASIGTATIGEAWNDARIMSSPPRPLSPNMTMAGFAATVRCRPGDNLALHLALAATAENIDALLVVDYGDDISSGPFGEIMAIACQARGIRGLLISGAVRDSQQLVNLDFPVFAKGLNISGTAKNDPGELNVPLTFCGVQINPGDMVVGDADGVIVLSPHDAEQAVSAAQARLEKEVEVIERLKSGETTMQIYNLSS